MKIYIPYILVVFISAIIPGIYENREIDIVLSHIFLYKMFFSQYEESLGAHLWYISTLFQFYILFIPLCYFKERVGKKWFAITCCFLSLMWWIGSSVTGISEQRIWGSFFLQYLWEFGIGMLVADYLFNGNDIKIKKICLLFLSMLGLLIGGMLGIIGGVLTSFNDVPLMMGFLLAELFIH